ncbi:MAG: FHA domain-containing protein, partial [Eubacterium sp.]|nr:FHA domain-containing protein [Eubacterium sp.]
NGPQNGPHNIPFGQVPNGPMGTPSPMNGPMDPPKPMNGPMDAPKPMNGPQNGPQNAPGNSIGLTAKDLDDLFGNMEDDSAKKPEAPAQPAAPAQQPAPAPVQSSVPAQQPTPVQPTVPAQQLTPVQPSVPAQQPTPVQPSVSAQQPTPAQPTVPTQPAPAPSPFDDVMKEMDTLGFMEDEKIDKIPPQMLSKKAQQTAYGYPNTQDPAFPQTLMDVAERVETEKRARREAAAAAAAKVAAEGGSVEQQETVTSLVQDNSITGGTKAVPRFVRTKTGENIYVTKPEFIIGKSKLHADYAIENNTAVSREHCIIRRERNGANYIIDKRSTNGTYVNGTKLEPLRPQLLTDGTKVRLGDEEFIFRLRSGE